jgi:hypothetical protein
MTDSILNDIKKALDIDPSYTAFDPDITMHINSVFATLNQLGIGPDDGFEITGSDEVWVDFLGGNPRLNSVKTYITLKVKLAFDPPAYSFHIASLEKQIEEFEWRLNTYRESYAWVPPEYEDVPYGVIIDGGTP